jgi:hypothetical protein
MKWTKDKPVFKKDCLLMVATKIRGKWEYTLFTIEKTECDGQWYWGIFKDFDEWGDIDDLKADLYKTLPLLK